MYWFETVGMISQRDRLLKTRVSKVKTVIRSQSVTVPTPNGAKKGLDGSTWIDPSNRDEAPEDHLKPGRSICCAGL